MSHPDAQFLREYLQPLMHGYIVGVDVTEDEEGAWPVLKVRATDDTVFELEVSRDEEGNGPGFLFGLPIPRMTSQEPEMRPR